MMVVLSLLCLIPVCFFQCYWEVMFFISFLFFIFFSKFWFLGYFSSLSYGFGIDGFSNFMILLSFWIIILMFLSSFKLIEFFYDLEFLFLSVLLLFFLFLSFSSMNMFMFYIYFEASLIPTILFIFGWGYQPERLSAGFYFLFYTMFGSLPLLLCISFLGFYSGSFFWFMMMPLDNFFLFLSLILAFLIKMPMFIFHFWLPSAHVEAPVFGSMILAGVLLKLGGYGIYRVLTFYYSFCLKFSVYVIGYSVMGVLVSGLVCLMQTDMKCYIAYSSVMHMGLVICGLFTFNVFGLIGSLVLMIGHGLCSSGLFILSSLAYNRTLSRSIFINKGLMSIMPSLGMFWFLMIVGNMSSPLTLNLFGELMLYMSLISWSWLMVPYLIFCSVICCYYSIYFYSVVQLGDFYKGNYNLCNVNIREYLLIFLHLFPLNVFILKSEMYSFLF